MEIQAIYDEHREITDIVRITLELRNRGFVVEPEEGPTSDEAPWFKFPNSS